MRACLAAVLEDFCKGDKQPQLRSTLRSLTPCSPTAHMAPSDIANGMINSREYVLSTFLLSKATYAWCCRQITHPQARDGRTQREGPCHAGLGSPVPHLPHQMHREKTH